MKAEDTERRWLRLQDLLQRLPTMAAALGIPSSVLTGATAFGSRSQAAVDAGSLGTSKSREAKIKFDLWKQERLQKRLAGLYDVDAVPLKQLAEEHLTNSSPKR
jgi:hypothetical protein